MAIGYDDGYLIAQLVNDQWCIFLVAVRSALPVLTTCFYCILHNAIVVDELVRQKNTHTWILILAHVHTTRYIEIYVHEIYGSCGWGGGSGNEIKIQRISIPSTPTSIRTHNQLSHGDGFSYVQGVPISIGLNRAGDGVRWKQQKTLCACALYSLLGGWSL